MKKKLFAAAFLAFFAGNAMAEDAVVPSVHGSTSGTSWVMNIGLDNATDYVAFQMDIKLPTGVSAGSDDSNINIYDRLTGIAASETIDGSTKFVVSKNLIDASTNTYRIVGYNLGNTNVKEGPAYNDGMFNVKLTSSEAKSLSALDATISNAIFVKSSDLKGVELGSKTTTTGLLGDVNKDGKVNQTDAVATINLYLNKSTSSSLDAKAANVNGDAKINQTDAVAILNIYLNK